MPSPQPMKVVTFDGDEVYNITSKTSGQELFDQVIAKLGLAQVPLYGFQYTDKKEYEGFIQLEKAILSQDVKKPSAGNPYEVTFLAKFYPESVDDELTHPAIQRLFWIQVHSYITQDLIYTPPELCVLFGAQALQAQFGDKKDDAVAEVEPAKLLPKRLFEQHELSDEQWRAKLGNAWSQLKGTSAQAVMMDYLNIAQDLEMYGVTYFEVSNKKGTKLWLGVHNLGMDIYEFHNKVTPRLGFPWQEIKKIAFSDKKFTIKMSSKDAPDFKFYSPRYKLNKRILALCVGNHKMYVARRRAQAAGMMMQEDRAAIEAKIRKTKDLLLGIRKDLETVQDVTKLTKEDKIHQEAEEQGMDKFKTMKKAQSGDVKRRIVDFESLDDAEC